jgi:hypothetical protein
MTRKLQSFRPQVESLEDRWMPSTLTVLNNLDSGAGSLRADIAAANPGDTIVFAPSLNGQTITLTSGELDISKNLTIQGPGAGQLTISGNYHAPAPLHPYGSGYRVFEVDGVTATIAGLTISNGFTLANYLGSGDGGGILNHGGHLTVNSCTLSNNRASAGGGIYNDWGSSLILNGSTLTNNQFLNAESGGGGAIFNAHTASATVTASTLSGNHGPQYQGNVLWNGGHYYDGGAIYNGGSMTLAATTITNNRDYAWGGGIYEDVYASLSILNKSNVSYNNPGGDVFVALGAGHITISNDSYVRTLLHG